MIFFLFKFILENYVSLMTLSLLKIKPIIIIIIIILENFYTSYN